MPIRFVNPTDGLVLGMPLFQQQRHGQPEGSASAVDVSDESLLRLGKVFDGFIPIQSVLVFPPEGVEVRWCLGEGDELVAVVIVVVVDGGDGIGGGGLGGVGWLVTGCRCRIGDGVF